MGRRSLPRETLARSSIRLCSRRPDVGTWHVPARRCEAVAAASPTRDSTISHSSRVKEVEEALRGIRPAEASVPLSDEREGSRMGALPRRNNRVKDRYGTALDEGDYISYGSHGVYRVLHVGPNSLKLQALSGGQLVVLNVVTELTSSQIEKLTTRQVEALEKKTSHELRL